MSVTLQPPVAVLDDETRYSIDLAVGQWLLNAQITFAARGVLRAAGVPEAEIEQRRRARSSDPDLARVLHFAVVAVITRGRPEPSDVRRLGALASPALVAAILDAAASSRRHVALAAILARGAVPPPIDMNIGDY